MRRLCAVIILMTLLLPSAWAQTLRPVSKGKTNIENYLVEMFFLAHQSGSITLKGTCEATQQGKIVESESLVYPPQGPFHNLSEVMDAVSQERSELSLESHSSGKVRVRDQRVNVGLLQVHLSRVDISAAPDPQAAIRAVLHAPEVRKYLKDQNIQIGDEGFGLTGNRQGLPRLTLRLRDLTVADALDKVINFFPGVWIYSECADKSLRRVTIREVEVGPPAAR